MKRPHLPLLLYMLVSSLVLLGGYVTLLRLRHAQATSEPDPELTLNFPSATVTYKVRDLPMREGEVIIPSSDTSLPTFSYDANTGSLTLLSSPQDYAINLADLAPALTHPVPDSQTLSPSYHETPRYGPRLTLYNARLNNVHRQELILKLKDGSSETDFPLPPALLRQIIMPTSLDLSTPLSLDEPVLLNYILPRLTPKQAEYFSLPATVANVRKALSDRLAFQTTPLVLGVDDGPTSQGELSPKYLEVDLSQQKMYFFIGGKLHKSYRISTGLDYPTPVGEFHILNKAPLAFSGIYNVWMPYWMAFEYAGDVGAYLGVHEKAYSHLEKGKKIYNHDREIGDKLTGGCVALAPGDSQEVYTLSDVGMLLRIVP